MTGSNWDAERIFKAGFAILLILILSFYVVDPLRNLALFFILKDINYTLSIWSTYPYGWAIVILLCALAFVLIYYTAKHLFESIVDALQ
ncbi:MAG: hypothetical protein JRN68_06935 [Nitrososphaerota archaeon]|nr:hypothetical protein [Nitrososphaerota archaeon]